MLSDLPSPAPQKTERINAGQKTGTFWVACFSFRGGSDLNTWGTRIAINVTGGLTDVLAEDTVALLIVDLLQGLVGVNFVKKAHTML